jgi:hypothetical protein
MAAPAAIKDDFFERNLEVFEREAPWLHRQLREHGEPHSKMVFENGEPIDIEFQGTRLYGADYRTHAEKQVADYWMRPFRMNFIPPQTSTLDEVGGRYTYRLMREAVEERDMAFSTTPVGKETFFLIVYGVGLGAHIEPLIEETRCKGLVLVEPNVEFIYHSLFTFDWKALFERFADPEKFIMVSLGADYKQTSHNIRNFVRGKSPSFFDGTMVYSHYKSSVMDMVQKRIQADANLFLSGLGFLEDEILMVKNSFENLKDYTSYTYRRPAATRSMPAFVIGSGPSLDKCFDVLRANQDKAIFISCGTALGVLLANGIMPDFHMEMENVELVFDILTEKTTAYDLSDVCLVASTTVDPRIRDLFQKKIMFFRQVLASWDIFSLGTDTGLHEVGPTVTNAGLSFAQELGFQDIYFFGMDYGTRRRDRHHAKDSEYRPGGKAPFSDEFNRERPGNFGGSIYTHGVFLWARETVEQCIRRFRRGANYYNCSDGMAIEGAVPKIPKAVSLPEADKAGELASLFGDLPVYSRDVFDKSWGAKDWAGEVESLCNRLIAFCDEEPDEDYPLRYMLKICGVLTKSTERGPAAEVSMIRGSIFMVMISANYYVNRVADPARKAEFLEVVRAELRKILEESRDEAVEFLRGLEA